jgi:hypothetical protein
MQPHRRPEMTPMSRSSSILLGPEAAMALLTAAVFLFCSRHGSYSSRDVDSLERLMWALPFLAVPLAYATIFVPGASGWWWLGRVNVALFVALLVSANKVVGGFVAPGAGPSAGAYGIVAVISFGVVFAALANAVVGALILAEARPAFAEWFRAHRFMGSTLTAFAAVPIGAAMTFVLGAALSVYVGVASLFNR